MKKIKELNYDKLKEKIKRKENVFIKGKLKYSNIIFSFDCETSSYYIGEDNKPHAFEGLVDSDEYKNKVKQSELYIWMIGINDEVYYGRTIKEMHDFFYRLSHIAEDILLIFYIHNLAFDLEFIFNALGTNYWEIFSREKNRPIKAYNKFLGIEFRCSLMLTNQSLEEIAKSRKLKAQKKVGLLNYNVLRSPYTYLNSEELEYCEYDIKVLFELLTQEKGIYKSVYGIPLTQTGKVRRHIRGLFFKDKDYKNNLKDNVLPRTYAEYKMLEKVYAGGYTHSNYTHTNKLLKDVYSMDITSSYPFVLCSEKFPCQRFRDAGTTDLSKINRDLYAVIIDVSFKDLEAKSSNSFLSSSKIYTPELEGVKDKEKLKEIKKDLAKGIVEDNGRIRKAEKVRFLLCDVDYDTVINNYKGKHKINKIYIATKKYLNIKLVKYILELFNNKTQFKDVEGKETEYREAKEFINSIYGMFVTKFLIDSVEFNTTTGNYEITKINEELGQKIIDDSFEKTQLLNWAWGVWCAAYARRHLWELIEKIGDDVVYCDTDSIKFLNYKKHLGLFEEDNRRVEDKIKKICKYYEKEGLSPDMFECLTPSGKPCHLGFFTFDDFYYDFKTLGAKKYCYTHKNKKGEVELGITVAGLSKKAAKSLESVEDFKIGRFFNSEESGRTVAFYNTNQKTDILFPDGWLSQCVHGICIMPSTYLLGITPEYDMLIDSADILLND